MKRIVLGLCIALLVFAVERAAFAYVDTYNYVSPPDEAAYKRDLTGVTDDVINVDGLTAAHRSLDAKGKAALQSLLGNLTADKRHAEVAFVNFKLPARVVNYNWGDNEYLYNFNPPGQFNKNYDVGVSASDVSAKATRVITFNGKSAYEQPYGVGGTSFVSVKVGDSKSNGGGGGGGGCSALTLGAAALFIVPLFTMKRGKK